MILPIEGHSQKGAGLAATFFPTWTAPDALSLHFNCQAGGYLQWSFKRLVATAIFTHALCHCEQFAGRELQTPGRDCHLYTLQNGRKWRRLPSFKRLVAIAIFTPACSPSVLSG